MNDAAAPTGTRTVLVIDDTPFMAHSIGYALQNQFATEMLTNSAGGLARHAKQRLQAATPAPNDEGDLRVGDLTVAALAINCDFVDQPGQPQRSRHLGLQLFDWIRSEQQLTLPVVLWSFLSEARLWEVAPRSFQLSKGHQFVRLPASSQELCDAFRIVLEDQKRLSGRELEVMLGQLYGREETRFNPFLLMDRQLVETIANVTKKQTGALATLEPDLREACGRLSRGEEAPLGAILAGSAWADLQQAANDLDRTLRRKGQSDRASDIKQLSTSAVALGSFPRWQEAKKRINDVNWNDAAEFYLEQLQIIRNALDRVNSQLVDAQMGRDP